MNLYNFNPYGTTMPYPQNQNIYGARQQVVRVNGKNGADTYQLPPNSSILLLDESAPIIWLKTTDGAGYATVAAYYISHYNKLIPEKSRDFPNLIPAAWYEISRGDVDAATRSAAVKSAMEMWVNWEKQTKKFYEQKYKQLMELNEVAAAIFVEDLICHTTQELKKQKNIGLGKKLSRMI